MNLWHRILHWLHRMFCKVWPHFCPCYVWGRLELLIGTWGSCLLKCFIFDFEHWIRLELVIHIRMPGFFKSLFSGLEHKIIRVSLLTRFIEYWRYSDSVIALSKTILGLHNGPNLAQVLAFVSRSHFFFLITMFWSVHGITLRLNIDVRG